MHPAIIIGIVRSLIVDVAMGQIPRYTERISSFVIFYQRFFKNYQNFRCGDALCIDIPAETSSTEKMSFFLVWKRLKAYCIVHLMMRNACKITTFPA